MPRKPRFVLPGVPMHVVQRGLSRQPVFFEDEDYRAYLAWLQRIKGVRALYCLKILALKGQNVKPAQTMGSTQSIMWFNGRFYGASDPRRPDALTLQVLP